PGAPMPRKHPPHVLVGPAASTVVPRGTHSMGACGNRIGVTVDLGGARIVVRLQFAEATAQEIAQALRRKDIATAWRIAKTMDGMLRQAIASRSGGFVVRGFELEEYAGSPQYAEAEGGAAGLLAGLGEKLLEKILDKIVDL